MDLEKLRAEWSQALDEMRSLADKAKEEKRVLTEEESKRYDELEKKEEELSRNIKRLEKLSQKEEERKQPTSKPVDLQVSRNEGEDEKGQCVVWGSLGEQLMAVKRVSMEPVSSRNLEITRKLELSNKIMRAATGMQESVMAEGGFLVQTDGANTLLQKAQDTGKLAGLVDRYSVSTQSNGITFPTVDETSRANGSRSGGIQAFWEGEGDTYTKSKPKLGKNELKLKKLTGLCYLTDELLEDAPVMERFITTEFGREFGFKIDDAIINGDGAGKPMGVLQSPSLVSQAAEGGQTADTINAINLAKMLARLHESSLSDAVWVYNQGCKAQLMTLSLTIGSNSYPVMLPGGVGGSFVNGVPVTTILGLPAFALEQCQAIGDVGDIILFSPKAYLWIDKGGIQSAQSIHVSFEKSETAFRFVYRADGQPKEKSAVTPYKGANSLSSYIALAAR